MRAEQELSWALASVPFGAVIPRANQDLFSIAVMGMRGPVLDRGDMMSRVGGV